MKKVIAILSLLVMSQIGKAQITIPVDSAAAHIGETVRICTSVYGVKSLEKVTFINLGAAYPKSPLTVVIFAKDLANFSDTPAKLYNNQPVCVTGTIKEYKGKVEIVITKPAELVLQTPAN